MSSNFQRHSLGPLWLLGYSGMSRKVGPRKERRCRTEPLRDADREWGSGKVSPGVTSLLCTAQTRLRESGVHVGNR